MNFRSRFLKFRLRLQKPRSFGASVGYEITIFRAFFHDFYVVAWARIIFLLELSFTIVVLPSFNYFRQKLMAFLKSKFRELQNELPHDYIKALNFHRIHSLSNKKHKFGYSDLEHWYSVTQNGPNKSGFRIIRISGLQLCCIPLTKQKK